MKQEASYVGIDVAKARVDVAVRPSGDIWSNDYDEAGIEGLVVRLQTLGRPRWCWSHGRADGALGISPGCGSSARGGGQPPGRCAISPRPPAGWPRPTHWTPSSLSGDYLQAGIRVGGRHVNAGRFKDAVTLASREAFPLAGTGPVLPPLAGIPAPNRNNFSRLWPVQISDHSPLTFSRPRSRNCRKPRACLIWPKTGSTVCILKA